MHDTKPPTYPAPTRFSGLGISLLLAVLLMVLSYARIIGDSQTMMFRSTVLDSMMAGSIWGTALMRNLLLFGGGLLIVHLLYGCACWLVARASMLAYGTRKAAPSHHALLWFLLLTVALLALNATNFPRSSLGEPYAETLLSQWGPLAAGHWLAALVLVPAAVTLAIAAWRIWMQRGRARTALIAASGAIAGLALIGAVDFQSAGKLPKSDQPNIVLIGLDSVRSDVVSSQMAPQLTPQLASFKQGGAWFPDAITPLARTFPSMTSILTGRQPHRTGAYMNLLPRDLVREGDTLGRILKRAGYRTIYATDEVRFSNIDASYGFDQAITPPIGASEFLITLLADTPVSNALVNTTLGDWLFPNLHANRGAALTYDPDEFLERVGSEAEMSAPMFLTVHMTLSHWPYTWADAPFAKPNPDDRWPNYYLNVVHRVDQQFGDLLDMLERRGVLSNAIVIVYSDHGEAFGRPGENLTPDNDPLIAALSAIPQWGHGESVLSPHQYRVVLAMRGFGAQAGRIPAGKKITAPVSVMDIAPTIVSLVGAATDSPFDGRALTPLFGDEPQALQSFATRVRFTETEYSPTDLATADGKVSASAIATASQVYRIDPETDRIEVKREKTPGLLSGRQYAALGEKLMLAAMPTHGGNPSHRFIVIDLAGGLPMPLEGPPGADAPDELRRLWDEIHAQYPAVLSPPAATVAPVTVAGPQQTVTHNVTK